MKAIALAVVLLNPARLYFQPERPVPIEISTDARAALAAPPAKLLLLSPDGRLEAEAKFDASAASIDLAAVLPGVWDGKTHYVQAAAADGTPLSSPLVVVPLWPVDDNERAYVQRQRSSKPFGLRIYVEQRAVMHTTEGDITFAFSPQYAPNTVKSFSDLVAGGYYTNVTFHRIVPGFVIQGGDPTGAGNGGPGYQIDLERSGKPHQFGTLSMARTQEPDTAGSQFFICLSRENCARLDGDYAAFGDVVDGAEVVRKIASARLADERAGRPANPPVIKSAELVPAPPRKPE